MDVDSNIFDTTRVMIGRHKIKPDPSVMLEAKLMQILMPDPNEPEKNITLVIKNTDIVKSICHLDTATAVLMLRIQMKCIENIRDLLHIEGAKYDESWVIIETQSLRDYTKNVAKLLMSIYDELAYRDIMSFVNYTLKDRKTKVNSTAKVSKKQLRKRNSIDDSNNNNNSHIVTYPTSGAGAISITVPDFECLAADAFLNDVIINFYLQYISHEVLTDEQKQKTHMFDTFFYEALTNKPTRESSSSSEAQQRYDRVENWTKHVNLFEKDFIIVPINQSAHWFLAIICFPGLVDSVKKSVKSKSTAKSSKTSTLIAGSDDELFDGESSTIVSDETIKNPCILIFDSMWNGQRKPITFLREYLTFEHQHKLGSGLVFEAANMPGHNVKVPQQANLSDCGLFMLHYIEQFFKDPIKNFEIPIKNMENWFETSVVTNKRRDIVELIKAQMTRRDSNVSIAIDDLPKIQLPEKQNKQKQII